MSMVKKIVAYHADVWDIGLIKIAVLAAALLLAKWWPAALSLAWYWYAGAFLVTIIRPLIRFFSGVTQDEKK